LNPSAPHELVGNGDADPNPAHGPGIKNQCDGRRGDVKTYNEEKTYGRRNMDE
jgi:hypothetical protein